MGPSWTAVRPVGAEAAGEGGIVNILNTIANVSHSNYKFAFAKINILLNDKLNITKTKCVVLT